MSHSRAILGEQSLSRRQVLAAGAGLALGALPIARLLAADVPATGPAKVANSAQRYKIGACDWMMVKRQKLGAFKLAHDCGLDGVEVDLGPLGKRPDIENKLRDDDVRKQFTDASGQLGVEICSLAMSCFYGQPFANHPKADAFAAEWIGLMGTMGVKVGFLPVGFIKGDGEQWKATVAKLKTAAPLAEKAGVVLGVDADIGGEDYVRLLDDVGSPAVQAYYSMGLPLEAGRDLYAEMRRLGPKRICQIHVQDRTEKGEARLGQGKVDFTKVKSVLDEMGWSGWLVVERSRLAGTSVQENFTANASYLKSIFQSA